MSKVVSLTDKNFDTEVLGAEVALVDFGATWCGPCKRLEPIVEKVAEENPDLKVFKVDVDDCPGIASKFKIRGVPTILVFKNGQVANQSVGLVNKESLLNLLK